MGTALEHPLPDSVKPSFVIFDIPERQSDRMSKITNDGLTRSGTDVLWLYPYGISGRQRVKTVFVASDRWLDPRSELLRESTVRHSDKVTEVVTG